MKKNFLKCLLLGSCAFMLTSCFYTDKPASTKETETKEEVIDQTDEKYEIYLLAANAGYTGTYQEWLESIKGASIALQVSDGYIQMKYSNETTWTNLISIDELKGDKGLDGKTTELQVSGGYIQWKYTDEESWTNLIAISSLTGNSDNEIELSANDTYIVWKDKNSEVWKNLVSLDSLKGERGISISKVEINSEGDLIISYSDGTFGNAGKVKDATTFKNTYTVTFDYPNSDDDIVQVVPWGGGPQEPAVRERDYYFFDGWYIGDRKWDFYTNYYPYDMTLTAKYIPLSFKLTLSTDGGTYSGYETKVYYETEFTLPTPTKPGYTFLGWYDEDDKLVEDVIWTRLCNTQFHAKWQENEKVKVTFDANGGSLDISEENVVIGSYYEAPTPTNGNCIFLGWFDPLGNQYYDGYFNYESNVKLTARWGSPYQNIQNKDLTIYVPSTYQFSDFIEEKIDAYLSSLYLSGFNVNVVANDFYIDNERDYQELPDLYITSSDQVQLAAKKGYASKLSSDASKDLTDNYISSLVETVSVGDDLYAYPIALGADYFMYYDKSIFAGVDMNSFEDIIARCNQTNTKFAFECKNIYYGASVFFGAGCDSKWVLNNKGEFSYVFDTFSSDLGYVAAKEVYDFMHSDCYLNASFPDQDASVLISGTWSASQMKQILGDNFGVCKLPSYVGLDNKTYQMKSFISARSVLVSPQEDLLKEAFLHDIAAYLVSEEVQGELYEEFGWLPSNTNAAASDAIKNDLVAMAAISQAEFAIPQDIIIGYWWDIANRLIQEIYDSDGTEAKLREALNNYTISVNNTFKLKGLMVLANWQNYNSMDIDYLMEKNENGWSLTVTIPDGYISPRFKIATAGHGDFVAGYLNVDNSSKAYLDLTLCEDENNLSYNQEIIFNELGTYTINYNESTEVISIVKE